MRGLGAAPRSAAGPGTRRAGRVLGRAKLRDPGPTRCGRSRSATGSVSECRGGATADARRTEPSRSPRGSVPTASRGRGAAALEPGEAVVLDPRSASGAVEIDLLARRGLAARCRPPCAACRTPAASASVHRSPSAWCDPGSSWTRPTGQPRTSCTTRARRSSRRDSVRPRERASLPSSPSSRACCGRRSSWTRPTSCCWLRSTPATARRSWTPRAHQGEGFVDHDPLRRGRCHRRRLPAPRGARARLADLPSDPARDLRQGPQGRGCARGARRVRRLHGAAAGAVARLPGLRCRPGGPPHAGRQADRHGSPGPPGPELRARRLAPSGPRPGGDTAPRPLPGAAPHGSSRPTRPSQWSAHGWRWRTTGAAEPGQTFAQVFARYADAFVYSGGRPVVARP